MKHGFSACRPAALLFLVVILSFSPCAQAAWEKISIPGNRESLDTVWGTSNDNVYVIGFTGHIYHKEQAEFEEITDTVFGNYSINTTLTAPETYPLTRLPYGMGGTSADNVFITGMTVKTVYLSTGAPWATTFYEAEPFVMRFDGTSWTDIPLDGTLDDKYVPQVIVGICGTAPDSMFFSGWKVIRQSVGETTVDVNTGVVLSLDALSGQWTGEVGNGDLSGTTYTDRIPEINEIAMAGPDDVYAVGLRGLILHKNLSGGDWNLVATESSSLYFLRVWAKDANQVFAAGFNNSNSRGIIYRYANGSWTAMGMPALKQGQIPALWGVWGDTASSMVHAVGNTGTAIYFDGNSGNQWYATVSGTTTSLNSVWAADFNHAYACGEDGSVYYYTEGIRTNGVSAYPMISIAPGEIEFTDISPGEVNRWEWDFNDVTSTPVAPTADLDYAILVTAVSDSTINGHRIRVQNDNDTQSVYLETAQAAAAQADVGGRLLVTAVPGSAANGTNIHVQETATLAVPAVYHHKTEIIVKAVAGVTTCAEVAALLESLDLIDTAVPDDPAALWFETFGEEVAAAALTGGRAPTVTVWIDSGFSTHREIARALETHEWVAAAAADNPDAVWVRGREIYSNVAVFAGGRDDSNLYVNTDTAIDDYYTAVHTYEQPGVYTTDLSIIRPALPPVGTLTVRQEQRPDVLTYTQSLFAAATPGSALNGYSVNIEDGGPGCLPHLVWDDTRVTAVIESGVTLTSQITDLLLRHHLILFTDAPYKDKPWYVASVGSPDTVSLYGGTDAGVEQSSVTVRVLSENPLDFAVTPSTGVGDLLAVFTITADPLIQNSIYKATWYFDYRSTLNYGSVGAGTIKITTDPDEVITHHYTGIGTYNVGVSVLLDDNSTFDLFKEDAVIVRSPDEGKSSLEGGSGLGDMSGCFIGSVFPNDHD
ncbi:hypothetical protein JCM14469_04700 [Desulfatiferula olefinivorans]